MRALLLLWLFTVTFVTSSKACLEVTNELWQPNEEDLILKDTTFDECRESLLEKIVYMGFTFQASIFRNGYPLHLSLSVCHYIYLYESVSVIKSVYFSC